MDINNNEKIEIEYARKLIDLNIDKDPSYALMISEKMLCDYQKNKNVESMFNILKLEALIRLNRFKEVLNEVDVFINKYIKNSPKLACDFEFLKLRAIKGISSKEEGDKAVIEEIEQVVSKYPKKQATKLERRRLRVLVSLGMTKQQLNEEILKLSQKYNTSPATFRNREDLYYKKENSDSKGGNRLKEKNKTTEDSKESSQESGESKKSIENNQASNNINPKQSNTRKKANINPLEFNSILELEDDEFTKYAKELGQREKEFLLVARYKKQRKNTMADGAVKEYAKRYKEEADSTFLKKLKALSGVKKGAMDIVKWAETASNLNLEFTPLVNDMSEMEL